MFFSLEGSGNHHVVVFLKCSWNIYIHNDCLFDVCRAMFGKLLVVIPIYVLFISCYEIVHVFLPGDT